MAAGAWQGSAILVVKDFLLVCVLLTICITSILARSVFLSILYLISDCKSVIRRTS